MSSVSMLQQDPMPETRRGRDHQRYRSVPLQLKGRFLDAHNEEHPLVTHEVSCGGAIILSQHRPPVDAQIVCYIDDFARIAGTVARHTGTGFELTFNAPQTKRDRLADRLVWLLNADRLGLNEDRRETRIPVSAPCIVKRKNGEELKCRVLDISLSGANFESDTTTPKLEEIVQAGGLAGEVVRRDRKTFAIQFIRPRDPERERLDALRDKVKARLDQI